MQWVLSIFILLGTVFTAYICPADSNRKNVLFLDSYQRDYRWSIDLQKGIDSVFKISSHQINLQVEYLDSKKYFDQYISQLLYNYYKYKFKDTTFDAIITSDNNGFIFMLNHKESLFPEVPLLFCGVNDFDLAVIEGQTDISGIAEDFDFLSIYETARKFHPSGKRMVIVGNGSVTAQAIINQIKKKINNERIDFPIEYLTSSPIHEKVRRLKDYDRNTIVFYVPYYEEVNGNILNSQDILSLIRREISQPIYSSWDFLLGEGIMGGKMVSAYQHGRGVAELTLQVLDGKAVGDIPVQEQEGFDLIFDYNELKRFNLDKDLIPQGSKIINEPPHFYKVDLKIFWTTLVSVLVLSLLSFFLAVNIAMRKEIERDLRKAKEKYKSIFRNASKGIAITDSDHKFIEINPAFAEILGFSSTVELLDRYERFSDLLRKNSRNQPWLNKGGEIAIKNLEVQYYHNHSGTRWALINAKLMENHMSCQDCIEYIFEDITKRKEAEITRQKSEEKLRLILDNIPQVVFWQDTDLRFIDVNKSFCSFFGFADQSEVLGKSMESVLSEEDAVRSEELNSKVIRQNKPYYRTKWNIHDKKGNIIWLEINKIPVSDEEQNVVGILSTAEDITKEVNLERQLKQSQKMEALGLLSSGIAHDFNNILTSMVNSAELVLGDFPDDSLGKKDVQRIVSAGNRGSELVKQILSFSKPSHQNFQPFDIKTPVYEAFDLLKSSTPDSIQLKLHISQDEGYCFGNPTQIHQVVMNLTTNSIQAMDGQTGQIHISLEKILHREDGFRYWQLVVKDNGPGIDRSILDKVFDPFFSTKNKNIGTGLGLSVVHGIIMAHKGSITVNSIPHSSTRFTIFLPLHEE